MAAAMGAADGSAKKLDLKQEVSLAWYYFAVSASSSHQNQLSTVVFARLPFTQTACPASHQVALRLQHGKGTCSPSASLRRILTSQVVVGAGTAKQAQRLPHTGPALLTASERELQVMLPP